MAPEFALICLSKFSICPSADGNQLVFGFLWQLFCNCGGGGGDGGSGGGSGSGMRPGHGDLTDQLLVCVSNCYLCLFVCQTCQRWSHTIPIHLLKRGGPASLTCLPSLLMKETTQGKNS